MSVWVSVSILGGFLSLIGLAALVVRYRQGRVTLRFVVACAVGVAAFAAYAVVEAVRPEAATGSQAVALLLPAFVALVVVIHERGRLRSPVTRKD